jgi:uncharacterized membrane-anchored protein YhcB (DUF1043 family)
MMFWFWIIIALLVGVALGVGGLALVSGSNRQGEIIADLYQALNEWVEDIDRAGMVPRFLEKKYARSRKALNRARGM